MLVLGSILFQVVFLGVLSMPVLRFPAGTTPLVFESSGFLWLLEFISFFTCYLCNELFGFHFDSPLIVFMSSVFFAMISCMC